MTTSRAVTIGDTQLSSADVHRVAVDAAPVELHPDASGRMQRSHAFVRDLAARQVPVYGLTTGCGPLAGHAIPADRRSEFQVNLIRSHAVGLGPPLPTAFVRAAMVARAQVLAQGYSGVDPEAVELLLALLNRGIHPIVREVGSVGASGDLVELAQIALVLIGEGAVERQGRTLPASHALAQAGLRPLRPALREGLALINGTCCHAGAAAVLAMRAERIVAASQVAAALIFDALGGNLEAYDPVFASTRPHAGQAIVAARLTRMLDGSTLARGNASPASSQDAYTLRCIPQILGPVLQVLDNARAVIEIELSAVTDNPLFLADEARVVHGGNFHGQPVAMALDQLKAAMAETGVLSERRLARVLDAKLNGGLPPFLIRDGAGLRSGFMGLQYCASSMAADNAVLAAPASVHSVPTNANNQDVVSMGMVAARQAARVIDNVERMVAIELLCGAQALDLRGSARAGVGTRAAHAAVRCQAAPLIEDRPLRDDVEAMVVLVRDGDLVAAVDAAVGGAGRTR